MEEKYVLIKPYECNMGTLPEGSEIMFFRGQYYFNGGPVPPTFDDIMGSIIRDPSYVRKVRIQKNEF